ncbi:MAG: succinate dehydrogenase, hydrophobic membrane anchor protein [Geminicoccaceae bacterium]|nr:succinate dehydrogenase, hydrophobic membrane anchor protein [Geminicoccaceae bacterium]MCX8100831.1 succinate dehydrogenase, hydrophobic membrane anchor protein [Geminicoccaceae bacterium]MDW8370089.1 succinate dehydrogenase, hydrophobic membrane anchor protein [Geminicoccaceae bacterium]
MVATGRYGVARLKAQGSARSGAEHWWRQRLTALANIPLVIWFVVSAVSLSGASYEEVRAWLGGLFNTTMMLLLIVSVFAHARMGIQVVIEDYVHARAAKLAALVALDLATAALATACIVAVLTVSLRS